MNVIPFTVRDNTGSIKIDPAAFDELCRQNSAMPDVKTVAYNLKTQKTAAKRDADGKLVIDPVTGKPVRETIKLDNPILTTIVKFYDNSKVVVSNSDHDTVKIDPTTGCADESSKEIGLVYAIAKRMLGRLHWKTGIVDGNGFGAYLRKCVKNAYDQSAQKPVKEKGPAPAPKSDKVKQPSLRSCVKELQNTIALLNEKVESINK